MNEVRFKVGGKVAREAIAAMIGLSPWYARPQLAALLEKVDELGIEVSVRRSRPKHSDEQRGYYHMCVGILAKSLGMTHDECHEAVLVEWAGSREVNFNGRTILVPLGRSSTANKDAYSELIETLMRCAAFAGVVLPEPETVSV